MNKHKDPHRVKVGDLWITKSTSGVVVITDVTDDVFFIYDHKSGEDLSWDKSGLDCLMNSPNNQGSLYQQSYFVTN